MQTTVQTAATTSTQQADQTKQQDSKQQQQPAGAGYGGLQSQNILGSKLQILTIAQVKYEGVLSEIDPINKAMTLINVKSYGSEGRRGGQNEIPPADAEIQEARFKVDHIKDFKIIEKPNPTLLDPAILSTTNEKKQQQTGQNTQQKQGDDKKQIGTNQQDVGGQGSSWRNPSNNQQPPQQPPVPIVQSQQYDNQQQYNQQYNQPYQRGGRGGRGGYDNQGRGGYDNYQGRGGRGGRGGYDNQGRGGHRGGGSQYQQKRIVGELQQNPNESLKEQLKENFDFEQHHLKDDSQHLNEEEKKNAHVSAGGSQGADQNGDDNTGGKEDNKPKYDKSAGFFDMISNSTQKKNDPNEPRSDFRKKDAETFGLTTSSNFQYDNSRGRGGRGGRGGYRGGGGYQRGGYDNPGRGGYDNPSRGGYDNPGRGGYDNQGRGGYDNQGRGGYQRGGRGGYDKGGYDNGGYQGGYNQRGGSRGGYRGGYQQQLQQQQSYQDQNL